MAAALSLEKKLARAERRLDAHDAIAHCLASAPDATAALRGVLELVCRKLDWSVGILWRVDALRAALVFEARWSSGDPRAAAFVDACAPRLFQRQEGLPGRIWASREPAWLDDLATAPAFTRGGEAQAAGLVSAFGFPVVVEGSVRAVLEFFSRSPRGSDPELLDLMRSVGTLVGNVVVRLETDRALLEAEGASRIREARKQAILDASLDAIVTVDHEGAVVEWSRAAERIFGFTRSEMLGADLADAVIPERLRAIHRAGLRAFVESGSGRIVGQRTELPARRKDGTEFPAEIAITRVGQSAPPVFTAFVRDITDRVQRRDALEAANRLKDEFLRAVTHELRTPLQVIVARAELCADAHEADPDLCKHLDAIGNKALLLGAMVDHIVLAARLTSGERRPAPRQVDLAALVREVVAARHEEAVAKQITLALRGAPTAPALVDPALATLAVSNLVDNALKFTPRDGEVTVSVAIDGARATVSVTDTGNGIDPAYLPHVFEPFRQEDGRATRRFGGVGLGLSIVKRIAELHGGSASVTSGGTGQGSTFRLVFGG